MSRLTVSLLVALFFILTSGEALADTVVEVDPNFGSEKDGRNEGWLGYALARATWTDGAFFEKFPDESEYRYSFHEEFYARESLALIWKELRDKHEFEEPYISSLVAINDAGFLREYVWSCLRNPSWKKPEALRSAQFKKWSALHIPGHRVETWVSASKRGGDFVLAVGRAAHPPRSCP